MAWHYLSRFDASAERLRRVLVRHIQRSSVLHGTDPATATRWVDDLVDRLTSLGYLDDAGYSARRAQRLRQRGASARMVRIRLQQDGVPPALIDRAVADSADTAADADADGSANSDLVAAWALARRRRLGPFRRPSDRSHNRRRDLAALARVGFTSDVAIAVIDADIDTDG